jgi:hypothetical protein
LARCPLSFVLGSCSLVVDKQRIAKRGHGAKHD